MTDRFKTKIHIEATEVDVIIRSIVDNGIKYDVYVTTDLDDELTSPARKNLKLKVKSIYSISDDRNADVTEIKNTYQNQQDLIYLIPDNSQFSEIDKMITEIKRIEFIVDKYQRNDIEEAPYIRSFASIKETKEDALKTLIEKSFVNGTIVYLFNVYLLNESNATTMISDQEKALVRNVYTKRLSTQLKEETALKVIKEANDSKLHSYFAGNDFEFFDANGTLIGDKLRVAEAVLDLMKNAFVDGASIENKLLDPPTGYMYGTVVSTVAALMRGGRIIAKFNGSEKFSYRDTDVENIFKSATNFRKASFKGISRSLTASQKNEIVVVLKDFDVSDRNGKKIDWNTNDYDLVCAISKTADEYAGKIKAWREANSKFDSYYPEMKDVESILTGFVANINDQNYIDKAVYFIANKDTFVDAVEKVEVFIKEIIDLINAIDEDDQIEEEVWKQGNILSQIYEIYNNSKKAALKASGDKVEYDKVHVQSQIYTPEWVVKFLVDNSLGKLYLEMYPDSEIKDTHKIIGDFSENTREIKPLDEVKVIDPCVGSGNFLLYCFDLFYDLYMDQIENYGADYNSREVPQIIIEKNLHGIDLDERAVQLTKVGLFIKAKTKRNSVEINHYNVVSASFRLPDYKEIGNLFDVQFFSKDFSDLLQDVWKDLQQAHKFGSLLRIDEKFEDKKKELKAELGEDQLSLFTYEKAVEFDLFEQGFYVKLKAAVEQYVVDERTRFYADETSDAVRFLEVMAQKYDVLMSNPPYTDYNDFGDALRGFINNEYKKPLNLTTNLYSAFVKRDLELLNSEGYLALIHPDTFMYISTFEDLRQYSLRNMTYQIFVDYGLDRINLFGKNILVNAVWYVAKKAIADTNSTLFLDIADKQQEKFKKGSFELAIDNIFNKETNKRVYGVNQKDFLRVSGLPYMYYVSEQLRSKFYLNSIDDSFKVCVGLQTGSNEQFVRMWWEIQEKYNTPYNAKWYTYAKGGPYCKWYGNNWAVVNWENDGEEIKHNFDEKGKLRARPQNSNYYLKNGITYTAGGGKKTTFRQLKNESMFDVGGSCIFPIADGYKNIEYLLAFMNSRFAVFLMGMSM